MAGPIYRSSRTRGAAAVTVALVVVALSAALAGCGGRDEAAVATQTTAAGASAETTVAGASAETKVAEPAPLADQAQRDAAGLTPAGEPLSAANPAIPGGLTGAELSLGRKVISNASVQVQVKRGTFQTAFEQATLLADKYGGYIVASDSTATGEDNVVRSGTVALRVPAESLPQVLADLARLGDVKSRRIETQDVTEEYVDLKARLANAQVQEEALRALMDRAKSIDDVLRVRQVLAQTQQEIEQLKGRIRFLDEHTSYATVTLSLYEAGVQVASSGDWGVGQALKNALHAFVDSANAILVGLAGALPALILLALLAWIVYRVVRPWLRRRADRNRAERPVSPYGHEQQPSPAASVDFPGPPAAQATPAQPEAGPLLPAEERPPGEGRGRA